MSRGIAVVPALALITKIGNDRWLGLRYLGSLILHCCQQANALIQQTDTLYEFAPNTSSRPSQSFTTNSLAPHGITPSFRVNSTPFAAYSA